LTILRLALIPALLAAAAGAQEVPKSQPPLWAATPDVAAFERLEAAHLAEAQRHIDAPLAVKGPRSAKNSPRPFDAALEQINAANYYASFMQQVHPDAKFRDSATQMTRQASGAAIAHSLNRQCTWLRRAGPCQSRRRHAPLCGAAVAPIPPGWCG
jgi:hypothetical protein